MNLKYEFTGETKKFDSITLRRIRRLSDGLVGGWIESKKNLSQEGNAFVYGYALVYGDAMVCGNARVYGNAWVFGNAQVFGYAQVDGNAQVYGNARVSGNAKVSGNAMVYGSAWVDGNAQVYGNALIDRPFPVTEEFIGWKKVRGAILKLQILGARRGGWGRKCRTNHCLVLESFPVDGESQKTTFASMHDPKFTYTVSKQAVSWTYNPDPNVECGAGIHFFCSRAEAENY